VEKEGEREEDQLKSNLPVHSLRRCVLLREIMNTCLRIQSACPSQTTLCSGHDIVVSFRVSQIDVTRANSQLNFVRFNSVTIFPIHVSF